MSGVPYFNLGCIFALHNFKILIKIIQNKLGCIVQNLRWFQLHLLLSNNGLGVGNFLKVRFKFSDF